MDVEDLARQAGGLFIFAHTAIEVIKDKKAMDPESQLAMLKSIGFHDPAFNLNALYSSILQKAMPETVTTIVQERFITIIHAIVGLRAPLALFSLERLLGIDGGYIRGALDQLRSIFDVPDNDEDTVQVIHPSFARYIADEEFCTEKRFVMGGQLLHNQLAKACLKQMKAHLKQNICNFKDFMTVEVPIKTEERSDVDLQQLSAELKYSCENFAAHVLSADRQDGELCAMVAEWANQFLPYWLEVLALIGSFHHALPSLRSLSNFIETASASHDELPATDGNEPSAYDNTEPPRDSHYRIQVHTSKSAQSDSRSYSLGPPKKRRKVETPHEPLLATEQLKDPKLAESSQLLADAIRMVSEYYDDIKRFPHQIYTSCLTFCPVDSTLSKQYSQLSTVRVLSGKRKHWRPLLHSFKDPDGDVISLTFSPDGTTLASCSSAGKILLWNLETRESCRLDTHTLRRDTAFTFSPDGKYIAADGNVYRATTGGEVLTPGICSAFSPDSLYIALGCDDGIIRLHDMEAPNLSLFDKLSGHEGSVTTLVFSSDNELLVSASSDDTIRVWNCSSREMMKQIPCREPGGYVTFSPYGKYVAAHYESFVRGKGFETYVWVADIQTGKEKLIEVSGDHDRFHSARSTLTTTILSSSGDYVAFCNGGNLYVVRQTDASRLMAESDVVRWIAETEAEMSYAHLRLGLGFLGAAAICITSISFTPDEQGLLVGNEKGLIRSWRIPKYGRPTDTFDFECKAHFGAVQAIAFSPNAKYFASASNDGSICVWDSTSVDLHEPDLTHSSDVLSLAVTFAPDGQTVAIESGNGISKMDPTTGRSIFHKKGPYLHGDPLISADGKYLASRTIQELLFWDTGSTSCKWGRDISAHAFSPDATHYAMLFTAGQLWVHDLRNGETRKMVHTNRRGYFWKLRFSPDSRHIVSYGGDICVFDVEKGAQTDLNHPVRRNVSRCAFSPCGQHIAIAHDSGLDVLEFLMKEPNVKKVHRQDGYWSVEFSPDGKYILASATDTRGDSEEHQLDLFHPDTLEILYTTKLWSRQHRDQAMREFRRTGRLLNHPLFQPSDYENFPYHLDKDGWVVTASSKRLCRLPVANRGETYDVNGNRILVVSPEGKVTLIQFGPNPICIPTPAC